MINDYHFPEWVNWIAQDSDGVWWGYSVEPLRNDKGWYENEVGRCVRLGQGNANRHWRRALFPADGLFQGLD